MAYADQQMSGNKITALIVVALLHVVVGYALISGLAYSAFKKIKEVTTAVKYCIPIRHVLLVNGALGKITQEQRAGEYDVWQTALHNPDFAAFAELCGATGIRVDRRDELDAAFARAFAVDGPVTLAIACDAELI